MTIREESRRLFNICKANVQMCQTNLIPHVSGTQNKKTRMYKIIEGYRKDANIDLELGVIDQEEYSVEIKAIQLFEKMLANFNVY